MKQKKGGLMMGRINLANEFLKINLDALMYISDIVVNGSKCLRDNKDFEITRSEIFEVLTSIENLKLEYEAYGED